MTKNEWKTSVNEAVERLNMEKLLRNCISPDPHGEKIKTKHIHQQLTSTTTTKERRPSEGMINGTKQRAKTIILSRYHMLECGTNLRVRCRKHAAHAKPLTIKITD